MLGWFLAGQYAHTRDGDPSAIGNWKVKDVKMDSITDNPLAPVGQGFTYATEAITKDDIEQIKYKRNVANHSFTLNGAVDFQPKDNLNFTLGGNFNYTNRHNYIFGYSLYNPENNPQQIITDWNVFARFTQKFKKPSSSGSDEEKISPIIKNAYYQVQLDYAQRKSKVQDDSHKDNFFDYGYIGKFKQLTEPFYALVALDSFQLPDSKVLHADSIYEDLGDAFIGYIFQPGDKNEIAANYTKQLYGTDNQIPGYEGWYSNQDILGFFDVIQNGIINGQRSRIAHSLWYSHGRQYNGYSISNNNQFRMTALGSAEIKSHTIKLGFEFEQRVQRSFFVSPLSLWGVGGGLLNDHIILNDPSNYSTTMSISGNDTTITVDYNSIIVPEKQSVFDKNLREKLGLALGDQININELSPDQLSLALFSADELVRFGSVSYSGYSYFGDKSKKDILFDDYFSDSLNRPIDAFRPIYTAAFIEDKFEINDLIVRLGLRVDRYDANQVVLKDKYSLVNLRSVGETDMTLFNNGNYVKPSVVGDDWAVYVNKSSDNFDGTNQDDYTVLGFRNEDTWYNAQGEELQTAEGTINPTGNVFPWYDLNGQTYYDEPKLSTDAFEDFKPQIIVMPRVSFSFPISEEALFFAHYDVLTQRPTRNFVSPVSYFFLSQSVGPFLNNPNLKPQNTIDYEVGFQQSVSKSSALKFSAFYRELRDQIQLVNVRFAYPKDYSTWDNIDFGTVKGFNIEYDLRRTKNLKLNANYTLQFAEGTGSSSTSQFRLIAFGQPNLRVPQPLDFDQRHAFKLNLDYRCGKGKGPVLFDKKIFENAGINFFIYAGSGTPYTKQKEITSIELFVAQQNTIVGSINGVRLPWNFRSSVRVDKTFDLKKKEENKMIGSLNVYVYIQNLFNNKNIINVYRHTGSPDDDGFLATKDRDDDPSFYDLYAIKVANPSNFSLPRRIIAGVSFSF